MRGELLEDIGTGAQITPIYIMLVMLWAVVAAIGFVDRLSKVTKGVAFHCTAGDVTNCVMESYLTGRKKKTFIA